MGLFSRLFKIQDDSLTDFIDSIINLKSKQLLIKRHAIEHAIDIIAKTISKSEILVYRHDSKTKKIKETVDETYYRLNIQPNDNEVGTSFFYKVIKKYLDEEEALILNFNNRLYLADSFDTSYDLLTSKIYENVRIIDEKGNSLLFNKYFTSEEVIHINLECSNVKETLDNYYEELGSLIGIASNHYKLTNCHKFRIKFPGGQQPLQNPITNEEISYEEYKQKLVEGLFNEEDSAILLSERFGLEKIDFGQIVNSEEWSRLEKKWSDKVAMSFNIPLDIFYGNKTDKSTSTNDFITFGVLPHLQIFEDSFNSKIIGKDAFIKGECIKFNRFNMKHLDILESAGSMDKLFSNGYSHNEINRFVGLPRLDEEWADKHYITKNYQEAEIALKGGDGNEG